VFLLRRVAGICMAGRIYSRIAVAAAISNKRNDEGSLGTLGCDPVVGRTEVSVP